MKGPLQYYLRRCSLELRYKIKKVIPHKSWKSIFSNSWVVHEDPQSIKLSIPGADDVAALAQDTYANKIQSLTGKSVEIFPGTDDLGDLTRKALTARYSIK